MPQITFEGRRYELREQESVLDGLLRHGVSLRSDCRSGEGVLPWRAATVIAKTTLSARVMGLRLRCPDGVAFQAGQFIHIRHGERVRSCSLAQPARRGRHPGTACLSHRRRPGCDWIHDQLAAGERLDIQGRFGNCSYRLATATGCGLAPLRGITTAPSIGHRAPIHLYHGSPSLEGVYLSDEMRAQPQPSPGSAIPPASPTAALPAAFPRAAPRRGIGLSPLAQGLARLSVRQQRMVKSIKRRAFLAGAPLNHIHADPFEFSTAS